MDLPSDLLPPVWVDWLGSAEGLVLQDRLKVNMTIAEPLTASSFVASGESGIATDGKSATRAIASNDSPSTWTNVSGQVVNSLTAGNGTLLSSDIYRREHEFLQRAKLVEEQQGRPMNRNTIPDVQSLLIDTVWEVARRHKFPLTQHPWRDVKNVPTTEWVRLLVSFVEQNPTQGGEDTATTLMKKFIEKTKLTINMIDQMETLDNVGTLKFQLAKFGLCSPLPTTDNVTLLDALHENLKLKN